MSIANIHNEAAFDVGEKSPTPPKVPKEKKNRRRIIFAIQQILRPMDIAPFTPYVSNLTGSVN